MAEEISFIHAADLHLDSPFKGLSNLPEQIFNEVLESTFAALDQLIEVAISKQVDFVLIAGDLFDNEKQSLKAQIRLRRAFEKLESQSIHVYLSYGNHDYIKGNRYPVTYPENVSIFPGEKVTNFTFTKDGADVAQIYGFSYENRAVFERKAKAYKISDETIPYHIAMLHGSIVSNTEHDVYAPFQISDLVEEDFNYWALGHIHKREILKDNPPMVYPGNIQGRNRKETGEKGCYHVILKDKQAELSFIPLQSIEFQSKKIDVSSCKQVHDLEKQILREITSTKGPQLIELTLTSDDPSLKEWERLKHVEDIVDLINETTVSGMNWKYIFRVSTDVKQVLIDEAMENGSHFIAELSHHLKETAILPYIGELYQHKQARRYLKPLSNEEEQEIKEEAKQLLIQELLKG